MDFQPLFDRIMVKRIEAADTSAGGLYIPDNVKEKMQEGQVIAVGKGRADETGKLRPMQLKAGDRVLFGKYNGTEIKLHGIEYLIMREEEVLGILERKGAGKHGAAA